MVKKGSAIELNCTVESGDRVHQSMAVFWYLDDVVLDWMGQMGPGKGVQVIEKRGQVLESILQIDKARLEHGGRYTCGPTLGISDNVTVHIIAGEHSLKPSESFDRDSQTIFQESRRKPSMLTQLSQSSRPLPFLKL